MTKKRWGALGLQMVLTLAGVFSQSSPWDTLAEDLNLTLYFDPYTQQGLMVLGATYLSFSLEEGLALLNGRTLMPFKVENLGQGVRPAPETLQKLKEIFSSGNNPPAGMSGRRIGAILIDPGHGGKDSGTRKTHGQGKNQFTLEEKHLTLTVALELERLLKQNFPGKKILMTRRGDTYPTLEDRTDLANAQKLAPGEEILFISLHFNSSINPLAQGIEVWHLPMDYSRQVLGPAEIKVEGAQDHLNSLLNQSYWQSSKDLAQIVEAALLKTLGPGLQSRGVREKPWFVVRNARMPSVLVELGFVTNLPEAQNLRSEGYLKKLSLGLYNGLEKFIQQLE